MLAIRTILHPTDFSEPSANAFRMACALARDYSANLIVLHVLQRPILHYAGVMTAPPPTPTPEERQAAIHKLHAVDPTDRLIAVEHLFEEGDPATGILQTARERRCDLIVMGSHGRSGLGRVLMGSVAENVLRGAVCPVLTVKTLALEARKGQRAAPRAAEEAAEVAR